MEYFSVKKEIPNAGDYKLVRLIEFGELKTNNFGGKSYQGKCVVDGVTKLWSLTENMHGNILKAGFKEGDTFRVEKWYQDGKSGFNYKSPDPKNPYSQPDTVMQDITEAFNPSSSAVSHVDAPKDEYADKVNLGASINIGIQYELYVAICNAMNVEPKDIAQWWDSVENHSKYVAPKQKAYVNG